MLLAANDWGIPPWEIAGEPADDATKVRWFITYREALRLGAVRWGNGIRGLSLG